MRAAQSGSIENRIPQERESSLRDVHMTDIICIVLLFNWPE